MSFCTLNTCHLPLASTVSGEKLAVICVGVPGREYNMSFLSGCFQYYFFLSLVFVSLIMVCFGVGYFELILLGVHSVS